MAMDFHRFSKDHIGRLLLFLFIPLCVGAKDESHDDSSRRQVLGTVALVTALTLPAVVVFSFTPNPIARFDTVDRIPPSYFDRHVRLYAYTERVIDGDTIRVRHVPGYNWPLIGGKVPLEPQKTTKKKRGIADETLILRLYGVDCPELSKKNATGPQPFALEAKQFTSAQVYHQMVAVTLLNKDRYGRAIAMVETVPSTLFARTGTDLSVELARQGLAQLYTGGGAEYNNKQNDLEKAIQEAKRSRRGIWSSR